MAFEHCVLQQISGCLEEEHLVLSSTHCELWSGTGMYVISPPPCTTIVDSGIPHHRVYRGQVRERILAGDLQVGGDEIGPPASTKFSVLGQLSLNQTLGTCM